MTHPHWLPATVLTILSCACWTHVDAQTDESLDTWTPRVVMSQEHEATCLVKVGDQFPDATLVGTDGQHHALDSLLGPKLTVVIVWNSETVGGRIVYSKLAAALRPFQEEGVSGVAINRGDDIATVRRLQESQSGDIVNLIDTDKDLWTQIATRKMPRIYLLDPAGKILWMDIECSQGTLRDLRNAVQHFLKDL
jgi:hypothetical protein